MENQKTDLIIYNTADGKTSVGLYARHGMVWINQSQLAELLTPQCPISACTYLTY